MNENKKEIRKITGIYNITYYQNRYLESMKEKYFPFISIPNKGEILCIQR